ncbi:MAG TPA: DUF4252 domain-containing protein [Cyclobacteriaceae bacterium]
MQRFTLFVLFLLITVFSFGQSKSFQTLKDHFAGEEDVHAFSMSGFLCRAALNVVMEDEEELKGMLDDIDHIRFIVIPKNEFADQNLTVNGFRKFIANDSFEEVMSIRDNGEHINIFHRLDGNKKNRYFVLVEESDEVVALELKGYIDPELFKDGDNRITFNKK